MKNSKRKSANGQVGTFKLRNHALLSALATAGLISIAQSFAAPMPTLPTPCAGGPCGTSPINTPFVQAGSATATTIGTAMTISQSKPTAILNWRDFNIAKGYSVEFKQPSVNASALNKIWDTSPSNISGSLTSNGQLYLINHNGIIFGNGAQVNTGVLSTGSLIASSLDISDDLYTAGYLTNTKILPAFSGTSGFVKVESGAMIKGQRVMMFAPVVENGGSISTPGGQTVLAAGNKIYLEASQDPNLRGVLVEVDVTNPGVAEATLLDPITGNPLLDSATGKPLIQHIEAGTVTNSADITAERGNVTLMGYAVNQQGRISATTSVSENGSIKLLARYGVQGATLDSADLQPVYNNTASTVSGASYDIRATQTGKVTLATDSVTAVTPQEIFDTKQNKWLPDTATNTDGQGFKPSIVEVMGSTINMQSGSKIIAPGGKVTLAAISSYVPYVAPVAATATSPAIAEVPASGLNPLATVNSVYQEIAKPTKDAPNLSTSFINPKFVPVSAVGDTARVFLDSGSSIDVSGSDASVSVARNILTVQLRGSQLQDAPVQRTNRSLWGSDVQVDIRQGTPLANYSGEEAQIARTVAERTSVGGDVKLISTGDVITKSGSSINISGGKIDYTGANIKTTTLLSDGVKYDIANAAPDRIYQGIFGTYKLTHNKWGVTETFNTMAGGDARGRWDPGYVEGKSAGSLTVLAPHAVVNGDVLAKTVVGSFQRAAYVDLKAGLPVDTLIPYKKTWQMLPQGGTLTVGSSIATPDSVTKIVNYIIDSNVAIQTGAAQLDTATTVSSVLPASFLQNIILDTAMFSSGTGLNRLEVYSNKTVSVAADTTLKLAGGGKLSLQGDTVNMLGVINAPSGTVKLGTALTSASINQAPGALNVGALGTTSYISTRGQWVNDSAQLGVPDLSKPLLVNGGSISLNSGGDLNVATGTRLDASGGAWLDTANKLHGGNGGAISLSNGGVNALTSKAFQAKLDGLDLRSYGTGGGKGGALTIKAGNIVLGAPNGTDALVLPTAFFQNGGFANYNLVAQGLKGLTVTAGSVIEPKAQSLILDSTAALQKSGADVNMFAEVGMLPDWQRAPTSINLEQKNGSELKVEAGAVIKVDPTASITLSSTNQLTMLGTLDASAGSINLNLATDPSSYGASQSIWLGSQSKLLSRGAFVKAQPNTQNLTQGQVLAGGKININSLGYVVAQQGSLMDVSGASTNIDLPQLESGSLVYRNHHVAGDAGSISVQTNEGGFFDGSMNAGVEAASQAAAGKFSLTLNNNPLFSEPTLTTFPSIPAQIQVTAGGNGSFATQAALMPGDDASAGRDALTGIAGKFLLDANALKNSGFDQVALKSQNSIDLADGANLLARSSMVLDAPQLISNGNSDITSAHVTLSNQQGLVGIPVVAGSNGSLNVTGQLVDVTGNVAVSGVNKLSLNSSGDIRLNGVPDTTALTGSLTTQGDITLKADQIYPTTLSQFKLSVVDGLNNPAGKITVLPGQHAASPVLSAGGQLTLSAAEIVQSGVVKAPLGSINFNGSQSVKLNPGSLTSVSADGLIVPFGLIEGGKDWKYDLTGSGTLVSISSPPQKQVKFTAPKIDIQAGATVNLAGGGDLYANEFFAGSGGSVNVLDPSKAPANTFAIIPGVSGFAPYDPQYAGQYAQAGSKTTLQSGASVYLAGGNGIKAGYYTLLPASYALLPGAYRVTAVAGYTDRQPDQGATTLVDGTQIMAGKFATIGTGIQDARYSGFAVTSGAVVRTQSEFHDSYANQFFKDQATTNGTAVPRLAIDAGQLIVSAVGNGATLALDGTLNALPGKTGRGALVDLNGPGFDIVNTPNTLGATTGRVQLTTSSLNKLGAESLLIGGVRTQTVKGMNIAVSASEVVVDNAGGVLTGPEIIMAANNAVTVKAGSNIEAKGTLSGQASDIAIGDATLKGDGALLRISAAPQVSVARTNLVNTAATLTIEDGATVGAQDALLLDSSYATAVGKKANLNGKALSIAAQNIDIGTNPTPSNTALALSGDLLARAQTFKDLTLHSYNDINFYGEGFLGGLDTNQKHILNNLVLNTRSLNGLANKGLTNIIDANNVTLTNNNAGASTSATIGYGEGNLKINADQITLADGKKSIQGFNAVSLIAAKQIVGQGMGSVVITSGESVPTTHNLVLQAGQVTAANKANLTITAKENTVAIEPMSGAAVTAGEALNAKLVIEGKSIANNGNISLSSGAVTLHATGAEATDGVTLGNSSKTSATGISKTISGQTVYAQAGSVSLVADNGGVDIQSGALVDVSGATGGGDAGVINIIASKGTVSVAGELKGAANANFVQGSYTLDAINLIAGSTTNALTKLNDTLTKGGFTELRDMRVRTGDWVIDADTSGTVRAKAQSFRLTADTGSIAVSGKIDSSGTQAGNVLLAAKNNLTLNSGALLDAHATGTGEKGGKVTLEAASGTIDLNNQPIAVQGSDGTGGSVQLRATQLATVGSASNNEVALNNTGGTALNVSSGASVTVEAFKTYTPPASLTAANAATTTAIYKTDAENFAANAGTVKTRLGMLNNPNLHLTPGVELNSAGDLTLATNWDLSTWRFNDGNGGVTEPGILTLKAAGNLNFGTNVATPAVTTPSATTTPATLTTPASLTDGFSTINNVIGVTSLGAYPTMTPTTTASWSYRLVAGSDSNSADVMAVKSTVPANGGAPTTGNVVLVSGSEYKGTGSANKTTSYYSMEQIRTGTGSIDIAAGGNLVMGNRDSVIYTAGQPALDVPSAVSGTNKHFGYNGGDINIRTKGDVVGAASNQLITDWLWRPVLNSATTLYQPAWWVNIGSFRQNIGALGGGNVIVTAGGSINNLSAVAPSTGYVDIINPASPVTKVMGGGNLKVTAGGNINSGVFYVGNGQGSIHAGASLDTSRSDKNNNSIYTVLALGQGNFDVRAGGDLTLQTALNPTLLPQGFSQIPPTATGKTQSYFFTYGDTSGIALSSLSGNVNLKNDTSIFYSAAPATATTATAGFFYMRTTNTDSKAVSVYPGSLQATAFGGDITSNLFPTLFPSTKGNLKLVADRNIWINGSIQMSDAAPSGLQANTTATSNIALVTTARGIYNSIHALDTQPIIISAGASIGSTTESGSLILPKSAQIQAGRDIQNHNFSMQNLQSSDTTSIVAGRDIVNASVTVSGPGQVVLQAGRNVDLGNSGGITTTGNLTNLLLPEQGADITVLAGVGQSAATQSFIDRYINPSATKSFGADLIAYVSDHWSDLRGVVGSQKVSKDMTATQAYTYFAKLPQSLQDAFVGKTYGTELVSYVEKYGAPKNLTATQAFDYFGSKSLSQPLRDAFAKQVFFGELREAGRIATKSGNYTAGYDAIATLFPSANYKGDLNLYYSQIKTVRGGNINLLTPGGGINAGLANPPATGITKTAAELGIVTVKGGDVNAFVNNDLTVNQSRVFTLQGGNILMWSSAGNIDAGKGSKSVSSTPPPLLIVDPKTGAFNVDVTQSVVGSGIRVLLANKDVVPGTVDLYAPTGEINAGDAGIGAAGNIFLGAPRVVGADNINFGGTSAGVPVAAPAPVSITGIGNMQDAAKAANEATQSMSNANDMEKIKQNLANFKPSFLSVEVVGLGDEEMDKN